jgi:hypothetical protein
VVHMDKPTKEGDLKAQADRKKFESINKVEISPIISKGSRGKRVLIAGELKSPDEHNPKWMTDPEEAMAERKAKARAAKRERKDDA